MFDDKILYRVTISHPNKDSKYNGTFLFTMRKTYRTNKWSAYQAVFGCSADVFNEPEDAIRDLILAQNCVATSDIEEI